MSVRRKKNRRTIPGMTTKLLDKPREECSYNEVYPYLDASKPLSIYHFDSGTIVQNGSITKKKNSSFRKIEPFSSKESFVDRKLSKVGYLETDEFEMPNAYIKTAAPTRIEDEKDRPFRVEYDMDEQDEQFLNGLNDRRETTGPISKEVFEIIMTLLEIEWYLLERRMPPKKKATVTDEIMEVDEQRCTVCDEAECDNSNAIVFCDSCDIAVHQECYGVPFIPEGQWLCAQCQISRRRKAACVFCPNKIGALKQTDANHWAHVVCALWIPEASVKNTIWMEPICGLNRIPKSRWKLTCYICKYRMGACIQCSNKNCFQAYHPTCARKARLYMEMSAGPIGALQDAANTLHSYCDRHTPEHYKVDVQASLKTAQDYYIQNKDDYLLDQKPSGVVKATKFVRKRSKGAKVWRTAQGTPVIPNYIVTKIADWMTTKFHVMKTKELVSEIGRYWALKREKKRGAALSKRLQMALDNLPQEQQTENIEALFNQVKQLKQLVGNVVKREEIKLDQAIVQDDIIEHTYFPIIRILQPILDKAVKNLETRTEQGSAEPLQDIQQRFDQLYYSSVDEFVGDMTAKLADEPRLLKTIQPLIDTAKKQEKKL